MVHFSGAVAKKSNDEMTAAGMGILRLLLRQGYRLYSSAAAAAAAGQRSLIRATQS